MLVDCCNLHMVMPNDDIQCDKYLAYALKPDALAILLKYHYSHLSSLMPLQISLRKNQDDEVHECFIILLWQTF